MATRQETQYKRRKLRESIVESCRSGEVQAGDVIPPVRDLARKFGLSANLAGEVVQSLVAEGVLNARPGAGTTVGSPLPASGGTYLFLYPEGAPDDYIASGFIGLAQRGFETTVAGLGGASLTLDAGKARQYVAAGQLSQLSGVFSTDPQALQMFNYPERIARASYGEPQSAGERADPLLGDFVQFDNVNGGRQAVRHLIAVGHKKIAYLGLHVPTDPGEYIWSEQREAGWRECMTSTNRPSDGLAFHPTRSPNDHLAADPSLTADLAQMTAAAEAASSLVSLIRDRIVTAVVATNYFAARALFGVLQDALISPQLWPAVVCFDSYSGMDNHIVSALNLPWDEVGKAAAQLLWERIVGRLTGPATIRLVPMQLIPRLTCRLDWADASGMLVPLLDSIELSNPADLTVAMTTT